MANIFVFARITPLQNAIDTLLVQLYIFGGWARIANVLAIPVAAGAFYHHLGWSLRPEVSALLMSASSIIVAINAVMLRRSEGSLLTAST